MQVKDVAAAGAFMQIVDVLGDQPGVGDSSAQCGNRPVRGIRLDTQHLQAAPLVPAPDQRGIVGEGRGRGQGRRIVARPETAKGIAEGGNPASADTPAPVKITRRRAPASSSTTARISLLRLQRGQRAVFVLGMLVGHAADEILEHAAAVVELPLPLQRVLRHTFMASR